VGFFCSENVKNLLFALKGNRRVLRPIERWRERRKKILNLLFYPDLGLRVELGDEKIDKEVYGYGPTQDFVEVAENKLVFK